MKQLLFLLCLADANCFAGFSTSTNYTVSVLALTAGGQHTGSAAYANDGNLDDLGGLVTSASPAVAARTGYAGQLYEVTALALTAPATNLNPSATLPLTVREFLDDGTVTLGNPFAAWTLSGPLMGVNPVGVLTAGSPAQNTPATVTASLDGWTASLNLLVLSTGLPAGYYQLTSQPLGGNQLQLTFVGSNGGKYALDRAYNLSPPVNWQPQLTNLVGANGVFVFTNLVNPATNNFWRTRLVP